MDNETTGARASRARRRSARPQAASSAGWMKLSTNSTVAGRLRSRKLGALTLAAVIAIGGSAGTIASISPAFSTAAHAASHGYGYDLGDGFLGQEMVGDIATFCLEILASPPTADSDFLSNQAWATMNADQNAQVNQAVTEFGQIKDNNWAAATHLFVWSLADAGEYNSHSISGDDYYVARAPSSERADILAKLAQIRATTAGATAGSGSGGAVVLDFQVDSTNNYLGTLTVTAPAGMTGTVTLTAGQFTQNGSAGLAGIGGGTTVLNVRGVPGEQIDYKIDGFASFNGPGGYAGQVGLFQSGGGSQQHTAGPGPRGNTHLEARAQDPGSRSTLFQPALGTKVASVFVEKGQPFCDVVLFYTSADANGRVNEWPKNPANGNWAPITASGVAYGPFNPRPQEADKAPSNAPVFDKLTLTTTTAEGPGKDYTACTTNTAKESGYYTLQWGTTAAEQPANVAKFLPVNYAFLDRFAQVVETSIVASNIQFSSKMTSPKVGLGKSATDTFTPSLHDGGWIIKDDGTRVPVVLTHTVRYTAEAPTVAAEAPEDVEVISTFHTTLTGPETVETEPIEGGLRPGFINVQTCIVTEDQAAEDQGLVDEWCDPFGLPDETFQVVGPDVTTQAKPDYKPGEEIWDDVTVGGELPADGVDTIVLSYAQKPGITNQADLTKAGGAVCTTENLINTSPIVHYTEPGTQRSLPFKTGPAKDVIIAHVEVSYIGGTKTEISRGVCGDTAEMTLPHQEKPAIALASTGFGGTPLLIGGGVLVLLGLAAAALHLRRRKNATVSE